MWDSTGKALNKLSSRELNLGVQDDDPNDPPDPPDPTQPNPNQPDPQAGGGGRGGGTPASDNGKRDVSWRLDGSPGFTYLQLEPPPAGARNPVAAHGPVVARRVVAARKQAVADRPVAEVSRRRARRARIG